MVAVASVAESMVVAVVVFAAPLPVSLWHGVDPLLVVVLGLLVQPAFGAIGICPSALAADSGGGFGLARGVLVEPLLELVTLA